MGHRGGVCTTVTTPRQLGHGRTRAKAPAHQALAFQHPASRRICLDLFRLAATDSEADQTATPVAAEIQNLLLDAWLARNLRTILDSTNGMAHIRVGLLARARYWQRPTTAVLFDISLATVEAQNAYRDRVSELATAGARP
jgi:hypothetical protein